MRISIDENIPSVSGLCNHKKKLHPEVRIPSSICVIDEVTGGLKAGEIAWVSGTSSIVKQIPYYLSVNTVETFGEKTLFIDGSNQLNPYEISRIAKQKECSIDDVLHRIIISRAFTVHQLSTLITEKMESCIRKYAPQTVIINGFPQLYFDPDVSDQEAQTLLNQHLRKLQRLTKTYQLVTLLTFRLSTVQKQSRTLLYQIEKQADEIIWMNMMKRCTRIVFPSRKTMKTVTEGVYGQLSLMDFGMVM